MFIRVADEAKQLDENVEIPIDGGADGSVSLSILAAQFQGIDCMSYEKNKVRVRVVDDKLYHPDGVWDPNIIYITVYSKPAVSSDSKRKEQSDEPTITSMEEDLNQRYDYEHERNNNFVTEETDPNRRCVDLIVLGISYRSVEADVKKCFEAFGELVFCEIKRDINGQSRGFGFIRFKNYQSQLAVINKRHFIDGRHVDVKIPDSKTNVHEPEYARKIFVARLPESITSDDLREYFSKYGAIKDVYIPKPARAFAFVTFHDSTIVRTLFGTHIINGFSITVGPAEPKTKSSTINDYSSTTTYKRSKPDHSNLRTLTSYDVSSPYFNYYGNDMMNTYYQQYNIHTSKPSSYSNIQQTYWNNTHDDTTAMWQQQHYG